MTTKEIPIQIAKVMDEVPIGSLTVQPKDVYEQVYSSKAEAVIGEWKNQCNQDRSLREKYAIWVFVLVTAQIGFVFLVIILVGRGYLDIKESILNILIPSVLAEVFGMGLIVVKYLFTKPSSILDMIAKEDP